MSMFIPILNEASLCTYKDQVLFLLNELNFDNVVSIKSTCNTIDHSYNWHIHIKVCWKQGRTKLVLVPVFVSRILADITKYYSQIAFDKGITFCLQHVRSLHVHVSKLHSFVHRLKYNHYTVTHTYNTANTHAKGRDQVQWSQKSYSLVKGNQTVEEDKICSASFHFNLLFLRLGEHAHRHGLHYGYSFSIVWTFGSMSKCTCPAHGCNSTFGLFNIPKMNCEVFLLKLQQSINISQVERIMFLKIHTCNIGIQQEVHQTYWRRAKHLEWSAM